MIIKMTIPPVICCVLYDAHIYHLNLETSSIYDAQLKVFDHKNEQSNVLTCSKCATFSERAFTSLLL